MDKELRGLIIEIVSLVLILLIVVPVCASASNKYQRQKEVLEMPNLIEVQKDSYQWFLKEGLKEAFDDISPIEDYSGHLSLEFVDFELCEDDVK